MLCFCVWWVFKLRHVSQKQVLYNSSTVLNHRSQMATSQVTVLHKEDRNQRSFWWKYGICFEERNKLRQHDGCNSLEKDRWFWRSSLLWSWRKLSCVAHLRLEAGKFVETWPCAVSHHLTSIFTHTLIPTLCIFWASSSRAGPIGCLKESYNLFYYLYLSQ